MSRLRALAVALDRVEAQWLASWVLSAVVATLALLIVLLAATGPLGERTRTSLLDLQLSGLHRLVSRDADRAPGAVHLLRVWNDREVIDAARRAQRIDFAFPLAYGALCLGLALALARAQPRYPEQGRWVRLIALGALAALLDEVENGFLWWMLLAPGRDPGVVVPALATTIALAKYGLLAAVLPTLALALRRARP